MRFNSWRDVVDFLRWRPNPFLAEERYSGVITYDWWDDDAVGRAEKSWIESRSALLEDIAKLIAKEVVAQLREEKP